MKYKNIIFDLGGVLVNWNPKQFVIEFLKCKEISKYKISPQRILSIFSSEIWNSLDKGIVGKGDAIAHLVEHYNVDHSFFEILFQKVLVHLHPLSSGLEIFNMVKSKGYKTYILSNFSKYLFEHASPSYKFLDLVDGEVISYRVKQIKPSPQIYNILLDTYCLDPRECLFLDDVKENILGANAVGIDGIVVNDNDELLKKMQERHIL